MQPRVQVGFLVLASVAIVSGCSQPPKVFVSDQMPRGSLVPLATYNSDRFDVANPKYQGGVTKLEILSPEPFSFRDEWTWANRDGPPEFCIAFSGGGLRSAAFSLGAIQGFASNKGPSGKSSDLNEAQVISAVSGGSYALSALLAHHYRTVSSASGVKLGDVARSPEFADRTLQYRKFASGVDLATWTGESIGAFFGNLWDNGVFGRRTNRVSETAIRYRERLCRNFHAPYETTSGKEAQCYASHGIPLSALGAHAKAHGLPFFVIAATANIEESDVAEKYPLADIVFEFTPLNYGSDALWRHAHKPGECDADTDRSDRPLCLSDAIAMSGAAVDSTAVSSIAGLGVAGRKLVSAFNVDLAWNVANPLVSEDKRRSQYWKPFPYYYNNLYTRGVEGAHWHVSDGGHSENLGAFSLVRRMCKNIVIVDGEHDPDYLFGAYERLQRYLRHQSNIVFRVEAIDAALAAENEVRQGYDRGRFRDKAAFLEASCAARQARQKWFGENPANAGAVLNFPFGDRKGDVKVTYLKLALDSVPIPGIDGRQHPPARCEEVLRRHCTPLESCRDGRDDESREENGVIRSVKFKSVEGTEALELYACLSQHRDNDFVKGAFPHEGTPDLWYTEIQMKAYLELGKRAVAKCGTTSCFGYSGATPSDLLGTTCRPDGESLLR